MPKRILAFLLVLVAVTGGVLFFRRGEQRTPAAEVHVSSVDSPGAAVAEPAPREVEPAVTPMRGGAELAGLVKDVTGGPIARAKIVVTSAAGGVATVASDERGGFRVAATPGKVTVRATADGYAAGGASASVPDVAVEVLLTPESVLQGRVVLAGTDTPVEGARVEVGRDDERVVATSDAEGRFRLRGLAPGRYKPTATTAGGRGTTRASVLLGLAETEDVEIAIHAALTLRGRVVGPDGKGCAGAAVTLASRANGDERRARADGAGDVRIDGLFPGAFAPYVTCKDMAPAATYPDVVVKEGEPASATWKVETGHALAGIVVTADGKPVANARLRVSASKASSPAHEEWRMTDADADGRFRIRGLRGGTYALDATSEDAAPPEHALDVVIDRDVEDVKVVLAVAGGIAGTVVDATGAPATGAGIVLEGPHRTAADARLPIRPDGSFEVKNLGAGDYQLVVRAGESELRMPAAAGTGKLVTVRAGTTAKVRLVVESQKETIQGRVLDDAGNPVTDAFVEAEREDESKQRGRVHASLRWGWGARTPVVTDNDGAFLLGGLASGAYGIRAYRKGGGEVLAEGVKTGTTTTLTILRTGTIAGNVLDANGKPPADFTVTVRDTKRLFNRVETFFRTEGTFTVSDLPAGDFTVTATTAAGRALGETSLAQGERKDGIELVVEASGTVSGWLVALDDGAPVAGMYVIAFPAKGGGANNAMAMEEKLVSDADGRFRVERVAPGPTRLITFPRGPRDSAFASAIAKVDVPAGGAIELPPIKVARNRLVGGVPGDLGFTTEAGAYGQDPSTVSHGKVVAVRAGSSAAKAGLVAGDEVTSVDGYSVEGDSGYLYDPLTTVAPGTKLALGLRRGGTVAVTAASPAAK